MTCKIKNFMLSTNKPFVFRFNFLLSCSSSSEWGHKILVCLKQNLNFTYNFSNTSWHRVGHFCGLSIGKKTENPEKQPDCPHACNPSHRCRGLNSLMRSESIKHEPAKQHRSAWARYKKDVQEKCPKLPVIHVFSTYFLCVVNFCQWHDYLHWDNHLFCYVMALAKCKDGEKASK